MKSQFFFCFFLAALLLCAFSQPAQARPTPQASLQQVQQALDARDLALFERRVNVDALVDQGVALLSERLKNSGQNCAALPPTLMLMAYSLQDESTAPAVRAMLKKELSTFVRSGIKTGQLNGQPQQNVQAEGALARLLPNISTGAKTLRATGEASMQENGHCLLPASLHDAGNGQTYALQLRMRPQDDGWQVYAINNMPALMNMLEKESRDTIQ